MLFYFLRSIRRLLWDGGFKGIHHFVGDEVLHKSKKKF